VRRHGWPSAETDRGSGSFTVMSHGSFLAIPGREVPLKRLLYIAVASLLIPATGSAEGQKDKHKGGKHGAHDTARTDASRESGVSLHVAFSAADVKIIREHYAPRYRNLPPGLRKKVARGGQLPPGWQKKYEAFPVALEQRLPRLSPEYHRGVVDGHAVIYNSKTSVVIDVAVLF
jgi:hypothetical protein